MPPCVQCLVQRRDSIRNTQPCVQCLVQQRDSIRNTQLCVQCGFSEFDFANFFNAERIEGGPHFRPCAVATNDKPAADHAGEMSAALALASVLFRDGSAAEQAEAAEWLRVAAAVEAWGRTTGGTAFEWLRDVRPPSAPHGIDHVLQMSLHGMRGGHTRPGGRTGPRRNARRSLEFPLVDL